MKNLYQCDKCLKIFDNWEECFEHERAVHVEPESYSVKAVRYLPEDMDVAGILRPNSHLYPMDIHVTMSNGAVVQYTFVQVITGIPDLEAAINE